MRENFPNAQHSNYDMTIFESQLDGHIAVICKRDFCPSRLRLSQDALDTGFEVPGSIPIRLPVHLSYGSQT